MGQLEVRAVPGQWVFVVQRAALARLGVQVLLGPPVPPVPLEHVVSPVQMARQGPAEHPGSLEGPWV